MNYYFLWSTTTGAIINQPAIGSSAPFTPGTGEAVLTLPTTNATAADAYASPTHYLIQGSPAALVEQPYLTLQVTEATSGSTTVWTLDATLNNPPASGAPTEVTFTVAGNTFTVALTNNTASLQVQIHASVASFAIPANVSAAGTVSAATTFGGTGSPQIGLQCYTPTSGNPIVAPSGAQSKAFLQGYYAQAVAAYAQPGDIMTEISLLKEYVYGTLTSALTAGATPSLTLDPNTANFIKDQNTNILPAVPTTLETAAPEPASGASQTYDVHYGQSRADSLTAAQAMVAYADDVTNIPNLA